MLSLSAIPIALILVFPAVLLNSFCISMKYCDSHGDGNLAYWFGSIQVIPVYWLIVMVINPLRNR